MAKRASPKRRLAVGTRLASESDPESEGVEALEVMDDADKGLRFLALLAAVAMVLCFVTFECSVRFNGFMKRSLRYSAGQLLLRGHGWLKRGAHQVESTKAVGAH